MATDNVKPARLGSEISRGRCMSVTVRLAKLSGVMNRGGSKLATRFAVKQERGAPCGACLVVMLIFAALVGANDPSGAVG